MSSSQADDDAGRRPSGTVPTAASFRTYSVASSTAVTIAVQLMLGS
jgi:hypothetical protein